jgi:glycosyltransferase involved in cell wall biosynthesis
MSMPGKPVRNVLLMCAHEKGFGGIQVVLRSLVSGLEQNARHVYFLYAAPLPRVGLVETINSLGCPAYHCPMPVIVRNSAILSVPVLAVYLPIAFFHLALLIHRKNIDVVNCHYLDPYFIHVVIAARLLRVPVVVSVHGADIDEYAGLGWASRLVYRLIMRGADRVVACSEALARRTIEVFPDVHGKVTCVHNGLDRTYGTGARETQPLPRPYILGVCRHVHKKGVDTLLRAFAVVLRECPDLSLVLVGDGPLLDEHQALAQTLRIERHVLFVGSVAHSDVSAFFQSCTLFVLPSRAEPFGLVLLEAAYHRKSIVCTRVGGVPEIIADGISGVMVEPDDPAGMAAQIVGLVRDPARRARLGAQAYRTLVTRFLWTDRIHDYIAIYEGRPGANPLGTAPAPGVSTAMAMPARGTRPAASPLDSGN